MYLHLFASGIEVLVSGELFGNTDGDLFDGDLFEVVSTKGCFGLTAPVGSVGVVDKVFAEHLVLPLDICFQVLINSAVEHAFSNCLDTTLFETSCVSNG